MPNIQSLEFHNGAPDRYGHTSPLMFVWRPQIQPTPFNSNFTLTNKSFKA